MQLKFQNRWDAHVMVVELAQAHVQEIVVVVVLQHAMVVVNITLVRALLRIN